MFVPYQTAGSCCKTPPSSRQGWGLAPRSARRCSRAGETPRVWVSPQELPAPFGVCGAQSRTRWDPSQHPAHLLLPRSPPGTTCALPLPRLWGAAGGAPPSLPSACLGDEAVVGAAGCPQGMQDPGLQQGAGGRFCACAPRGSALGGAPRVHKHSNARRAGRGLFIPSPFDLIVQFPGKLRAHSLGSCRVLSALGPPPLNPEGLLGPLPATEPVLSCFPRGCWLPAWGGSDPLSAGMGTAPLPAQSPAPQAGF